MKKSLNLFKLFIWGPGRVFFAHKWSKISRHFPFKMKSELQAESALHFCNLTQFFNINPFASQFNHSTVPMIVVGVESLRSTWLEIYCCIRQTFTRRFGLFTAQQCKFYSLLQFVIKGLQFYGLLQFYSFLQFYSLFQFYSLLMFVIKDLPI